MKKVLLFLGASALLLTTACNEKSNYSPADKALGDSIANVLGTGFGASMRENNERLNQMMPEHGQINPDEYLRGIEFILMMDTTNVSFIKGVQDAFAAYANRLNLSDEYKIPVDPALMVKAIRDAYKSDSIDQMQLMKELNHFEDVLQKRQIKLNKGAAQNPYAAAPDQMAPAGNNAAPAQPAMVEETEVMQVEETAAPQIEQTQPEKDQAPAQPARGGHRGKRH